MMEIRMCNFADKAELDLLVRLQNEVYRDRGLKFKADTFKYWYVDNPEGEVISFNAFDSEQLIAHQSLVPERMIVGEKVVRCLRSMAVVTHPEHRKKGLFAKLTNLAVEEAKRQGYQFVYAVSNANSTPVFLKHCGFELITQLDVRIGFSPNIEAAKEKLFKRHWDEKSLSWRLSNNNYRRIENSVIGKYRYGVNTYMATLASDLLSGAKLAEKKTQLGCYLYVGLGARLPLAYFRIPKFIKHSPFNLIFKDLSNGSIPKMTPENVFYQLLDYDVV